MLTPVAFPTPLHSLPARIQGFIPSFDGALLLPHGWHRSPQYHNDAPQPPVYYRAPDGGPALGEPAFGQHGWLLQNGTDKETAAIFQIDKAIFSPPQGDVTVPFWGEAPFYYKVGAAPQGVQRILIFSQAISFIHDHPIA